MAFKRTEELVAMRQMIRKERNDHVVVARPYIVYETAEQSIRASYGELHV